MTRRPFTTHQAKQVTAAIRHLCDVVDHRYQPWLDHLATQMAAADGIPTRGERIGGRATAENTTVEAAADTRDQLTNDATYVTESILAASSTLSDVLEAMAHTLGLRVPVAKEELCSTGTGREGHEIPYVPHSRDPENGWSDATCTNVADAGRAGMCDACSKREDRWRREHGLKPRAHVNEAA